MIGDAAIAGGLAFEGLNNASTNPNNLLIILNDNNMAIDNNVGAFHHYLSRINTLPFYNDMRYKLYRLLVKMRLVSEQQKGAILRFNNSLKALISRHQNIFEGLNIRYFGPIDGHDVKHLVRVLNNIKDMSGPKILHVKTVKGKGFAPAEKNAVVWHAPGRFNKETGERQKNETENLPPLFQDVFGHTLVELAEKNDKIVGITPAMPTGCSMNYMIERFPHRAFDVGIAEEHAVALASGIAAGGGRPVYGVYSTFIQRTYDQLSQDLCINNNPAVICVFAASVWGMNDVTHLGIFDIPLISNVPNMVYLAPTCKEEYFAMLQWAMQQTAHPVAIRVPGNSVISSSVPVETDYSTLDRYKVTQQGDTVAIIALGSFFALGENVARRLQMVAGITPTLINPRYITGLDNDLLDKLKTTHRAVITLEDGILDGGFGEKIARYYGNSDIRVLNYGLKKEFVDRYNASELLLANRLTDKQITEDIIKSLQ